MDYLSNVSNFQVPQVRHRMESKWMSVPTVDVLLDNPRYTQYVDKIKALFRVPQAYHHHVHDLIMSYASYVRDLPLPSHVSLPGGLLEMALDRAHTATALCRTHTLSHLKEDEILPIPEARWLFMIFSAVLLYRIGELEVEFDIHYSETEDKDKKHPWRPCAAHWPESAVIYQYAYTDGTFSFLRDDYTVWLARSIMPSKSLLWIASDRKLLAQWISLLKEIHQNFGAQMYAIPPDLIERFHAAALQRQFAQLHAQLQKKSDKSLAWTEREEVLGALVFLNELKEKINSNHLLLNAEDSTVHHLGELVFIDHKEIKEFVKQHPEHGSEKKILGQLERLGLFNKDKNNILLDFSSQNSKKETVFKKGLLLNNPYYLLTGELNRMISKIPLTLLNPALAQKIMLARGSLLVSEKGSDLSASQESRENVGVQHSPPSGQKT